MSEQNRWAIIAHGGAKDIEPSQEAPNRNGVSHALQRGIAILSRGGAALEAVEAVVLALEDNTTFNAGRGSVKNDEGEIEMDASIMDGATLDIGSIAGVQNIRNPIAVAKALLREKPILLVGEGAMQFARRVGLQDKMCSPEKVGGIAPGCDTVGCVARDTHGNLAVATSTGGLEGAKPGRVGDVVMPGCGFYADNVRGAVSLSGEGEAIARTMVAAVFLHELGRSDPQDAAVRALAHVPRAGGEAGLIAITPEGEMCWFHNTTNFAVGYAQSAMAEPRVYLSKQEEHER